MRIGLHTRPDCPELDAFAAGAEVLGHRVVRRSGSDHRRGEVDRGAFDVVVTSSARGGFGLALRDYAAAGVPTLVLDFGYFQRASRGAPGGFWQVSKGWINSPPPFECPANRSDALGLKYTRRRTPEGESWALLLGQVPGDASHGLDLEQYQDSLATMAAHLRGWFGDPVVFRPHPLAPEVATPHGTVRSETSSRTLDEDLASASVVGTLCSTAGLAALLQGIPVVCDPRAVYGWLCSSWGDDLDHLWFPAEEELMPFLARLTHGQWTLDELSCGEGVEFALEWATTGRADSYFERRAEVVTWP